MPVFYRGPLDGPLPSEERAAEGGTYGPLGCLALVRAQQVGHKASPAEPDTRHSAGSCRPSGQSGSRWYISPPRAW
jgi:hypothetical protein